MSPLPVENEKELAIGGFQGIKKIRGLLVGIDVVDPPESWENQEKQVVKVDTEDTTVLEMFGDEDIFELKDNKFSFFVPYVEAGKKPHQNSIYSRCWLASAKELGHLPSEFIGQYVTLEKQARVLFHKPILEDDGTGRKIPKLDDEGKKILEDVLTVNQMGLPNHFCFVADETADTDTVKDKVASAVTGLTEKAALRKLLIDFKQHPDFKNMLNEGTLAKELGLELIDGKFQKETEAKPKAKKAKVKDA
jgi:hypothetical protein